MRKLLSIIFLTGLASCASLSLKPFNEYNGNWASVDKTIQTGSCGYDEGSTKSSYLIEFMPGGKFTAQRYSESGSLTSKYLINGNITSNGIVHALNNTYAQCDGIERKVSYPVDGRLIQTSSGPVLTLTTQQDVCPKSNCQFVLKQKLQIVN